MITIKINKTIVVIVLSILLLIFSAIWGIAQEQASTIYYACLNKSSGAIKVWQEPQPCGRNEFAIEWNREGPPGPQGLQGEPGPQGPQGEPGTLLLAGQSCTEGFVTGFDVNGNIICSSGDVTEPPSVETCDGIDNDGNGQIDEGLFYCLGDTPAPNTDGSACLAGFIDRNGDPVDGCEWQIGELFVTGIWSVSPAVSYTCADGLLELDFATIEIQVTDQVMEITAVGSDPPGMMTGEIDYLGYFYASRTIEGTTTQHYEMSGMFDNDNMFTGTFSVDFISDGSITDCQNQSFVIVGER